jgi:uncharacterized OB-fold protein
VRGLVRAAAYLSPSVAEGRRVAGPDEDLFTLLATALERVLEPWPPPSDTPQLVVVGDFPERLDWALSALSRSSSPIVRSGRDGPALIAALTAAEEGDRGAVAVLTAEKPERPSSASATSSTIGAGSAAFLFQAGTGGGLDERFGKVDVVPSSVETAFRLYRVPPLPNRETWVGDWKLDPTTGRAVDPRAFARFTDLVPNAVSEGAYVPRPRYLESLPSRWQLLAYQCSRCSGLTFPGRGACGRCGSREGLAEVALPRDAAVVVATTVIRKGGQPTEFDSQVEVGGPYEVVLAELAPGLRVTLQLTDADPGSVRIGDRVDTRLRRLYPMEGEWRYGRKAVPAART